MLRKMARRLVPHSIQEKLPSGPRECAFCDRIAELSKEHVWSDWINDILGPAFPGKYDFTDQIGGPTSDNVRTSKLGKLSISLPVVCAECNNRWMSQLETNHAKPILSPILLGRRVTLMPEGLSSLARFAFKIAVIADRSVARSTGPYFSRAATDQFRDTLVLPPHVQVWAGTLHTPRLRKGVFKTHYSQIRTGRFANFELYVMTWGVTPFLMQVTAARWMGGRPQTERRPRLVQSEDWNLAAEPCWPTNAAISFPVRQAIGAESIDAFSYRWTTRLLPQLLQ